MKCDGELTGHYLCIVNEKVVTRYLTCFRQTFLVRLGFIKRSLCHVIQRGIYDNYMVALRRCVIWVPSCKFGTISPVQGHPGIGNSSLICTVPGNPIIDRVPWDSADRPWWMVDKLSTIHHFRHHEDCNLISNAMSALFCSYEEHLIKEPQFRIHY